MRSIAIYMRVSSKRQDLKSQIPDLETWAKAHENGTPMRWFSDKCSGKTMDRPGWNRLEAEIDAGRVRGLICWRLDRLGRTASGLTALFEKLADRKVNLVSLKDGLDLSTPAGRLMANMLASVAMFENEVRTERILAGQQAARATGKRWGGSRAGRRLKVTTEQVETIHSMNEQGAKVTAMARATGLSRPTVYRLLNE